MKKVKHYQTNILLHKYICRILKKEDVSAVDIDIKPEHVIDGTLKNKQNNIIAALSESIFPDYNFHVNESGTISQLAHLLDYSQVPYIIVISPKKLFFSKFVLDH